jgi:hypothetical protein
MEHPVFKDFAPYATISQSIIEQYQNIVPNEIVEIWQHYGLGSFRKGFLKIINPEEYNDILAVAYAESSVAIPLFATGMGDIITWEDNRTFLLLNFGKKILKGLANDVDVLLLSLGNDGFCEANLFWKHYPKAVEMYGSLAYDECFGYVPLLGLGGSEKVKNLQKVKIKEQIMIITELLGPFE